MAAFAVLTVLICFMLYKLGHSRLNSDNKFPVLTVTQTVSLAFLIMFVCVVVTSTVFTRLPAEQPKYRSELFWSWKKVFAQKDIDLFKQIILNCVLLFPMGFLLPFVHGKKVKAFAAFAAGFIFSFFIELTQFITHRGLFEFDDMLHNALGCLLGCIFANILRSIVF